MIVKQVLSPGYSDWRVTSFIRKNDSRKHLLFAALCYRKKPSISNKKLLGETTAVSHGTIPCQGITLINTIAI